MVCYEMCIHSHTLYKLTVLSLWAKIFRLSNIVVIIYGNTSVRAILLYIKQYKIRIMFFYPDFFLILYVLFSKLLFYFCKTIFFTDHHQVQGPPLKMS